METRLKATKDVSSLLILYWVASYGQLATCFCLFVCCLFLPPCRSFMFIVLWNKNDLVIAFSGFPENGIIFYPICNTITWWFDWSIGDLPDARYQMQNLTYRNLAWDQTSQWGKKGEKEKSRAKKTEEKPFLRFSALQRLVPGLIAKITKIPLRPVSPELCFFFATQALVTRMLEVSFWSLLKGDSDVTEGVKMTWGNRRKFKLLHYVNTFFCTLSVPGQPEI